MYDTLVKKIDITRRRLRGRWGRLHSKIFYKVWYKVSTSSVLMLRNKRASVFDLCLKLSLVNVLCKSFNYNAPWSPAATVSCVTATWHEGFYSLWNFVYFVSFDYLFVVDTIQQLWLNSILITSSYIHITERCGQTLGTDSIYQKQRKSIHINMCLETFYLWVITERILSWLQLSVIVWWAWMFCYICLQTTTTRICFYVMYQ
jgi:hypothetical protein